VPLASFHRLLPHWQTQRPTSILFEEDNFRYAPALMKWTRLAIATTFFLWSANTSLHANGGAWQTGVPETGNGAASDQKKATDVTIEEEKLTIDLHQEFAAVEVRYRMRNTGPQVEQDFFFPMERWTPAEETGDGENTRTDLEGYTIAADGSELKSANVDAKGVEKPKPVEGENWDDFPSATKLWKKSRIPFARGQTREVVIRYRSPYAGTELSVSDDSKSTDAVFQYSLAPAATWKGPIGKGKVTINLLHPRPEEVVISKPKERFKKTNATQFEWDFRDLKPTLADDIKIIAHPAHESYWARRDETDETKERDFHASYVVQNNQYFLEHTDYDAVASSTLPPSGERKYDIANLKGLDGDKTWAEGVEGDGIGESIALTVRRPLPLDSILIVPGYRSLENATLWAKNNRVAELEVTLNGEHTFKATIPDEKFTGSYPMPVRDYAKPVKTVKLTIKGVHRGTAARDTCISSLELRGKLSEKPTIQPAR